MHVTGSKNHNILKYFVKDLSVIIKEPSNPPQSEGQCFVSIQPLQMTDAYANHGLK